MSNSWFPVRLELEINNAVKTMPRNYEPMKHTWEENFK